MGNNPVVEIETNLGSFKIELYPEKAPVTVENFLKYVEDGFYEGLIFHRVIPNFVVQGGGFDKDLNYKMPTYPPIKNEANNGLKNLRGTVAMARTSDPDSATSQFYINLSDNYRLDYGDPEAIDMYGYTVFGKVIEGMSVVEKIARIPTHTVKGMSDVPVAPVIIKKVKIIKK